MQAAGDDISSWQTALQQSLQNKNLQSLQSIILNVDERSQAKTERLFAIRAFLPSFRENSSYTILSMVALSGNNVTLYELQEVIKVFNLSGIEGIIEFLPGTYLDAINTLLGGIADNFAGNYAVATDLYVIWGVLYNNQEILYEKIPNSLLSSRNLYSRILKYNTW